MGGNQEAKDRKRQGGKKPLTEEEKLDVRMKDLFSRDRALENHADRMREEGLV